MSTVAARPKSLGELIQYHRKKKEMSLSKLQEAVGVDKGSLSRIENGEVKRPDFQSILSIAGVLDIPHSDIVEQYLEIGHKSEVIYAILQNELATLEHPSLITKIAGKFLEAPNEDTLYLVGKLYRDTDSIKNDSIKLSLYGLILNYSRSHGIMPYIAKSMYQRYLIERNDFSRLKETYQTGKYILHYVDFLSSEERVCLYYKLGIHAYSLSNHYECIDYCKEVVKSGESRYKADALGVLIDAYFCIGAYKESELYLIQYKNFTYPHTKENVVLMDTFFHAKKGNVKQAIERLESFLETCSSASIVPATKQLLQLYLQLGNLEGAKVVLENDKATPAVVDERNPLVCATYADYLRVKGEYYLAAGDMDNSIMNMVESALWYSKVDDAAKEKEALNTAMHIHLTNNVSPQFMLEKLSNYYQRTVKELEELA